MIIDLEHHLPTDEQVVKGTSKSGRICERYRHWDGDDYNVRFHKYEAVASVESHLQFMDKAGIDMAVLTRQCGESLERSRTWHDECAKLVKEHPNRFVGFASIPLFGGKPAFEELERATKELGLKGVQISSRRSGRYLDDKAYWPFYEKVSELGIPIDVHVTTEPTGFDALRASYPLYYIIAREFDICATTFRICLGGVLEDFPDLVFIINHCGGGVSAVLERMDVYMRYASRPGWSDFWPGKPLINKPWREYFNKLYFSMAGREQGMDTWKCALTNISPKKLMFATDWPMNYDIYPEVLRECVANIRKLDLPKKDIEGMLGGNAAELLGIKPRDAETKG